MPSPSTPTDTVRQLLSSGETEQAVRILAQLCRAHQAFLDDAILLESNMNNLGQKVFEGTISQEDETIEERRIVKSTLRLASQLENFLLTGAELTTAKPVSPATTSHDTLTSSSPSASSPRSFQRPTYPLWWAFSAIGLLLLVAWVIWGRNADAKSSVAENKSFDLVIQLYETARINAGGAFKAVLGEKDTLSPQTPDEAGQIVYRNLSPRLLDLDVQLLPVDFPYRLKVSATGNPKATSKQPLVFQLQPETQIYEGKVLDQRERPLQGAVLEFGSGSANAQTDASGTYRVALPVPVKEPAQVQVKIIYRGKIVKDEKLWQVPAVLSELKVFL